MSVSLLGFDFPPNIRLWKITAALKMTGTSYNFVPIEFMVDNESEDYKNNCHPMGRAPCLQTEDGYIFESGAILRHIARTDKSNSFLYGRTTYEAAQVDQWLDYCGEFEKSGYYFVCVNGHGMPIGSEEQTQKHLADAHAAFAGLDKWLETRTYLAGERISIADIGIAASIDWILRFSFQQDDFTKKYKNAFRHYNTVMGHPKFQEALVAHKGFTTLPKDAKK